MQEGTEVIFKAYGRDGVPQKILRVNQNFYLEQPNVKSIHLKKGNYIAAYKTPKTKTCPNALYLAPLHEKELNEIDKILKDKFNTSLEEEKMANNLVSISLLPMLPICHSTLVAIDLCSREAYKSDGKSKTGLLSIKQLDKDVSFWVNKPKKYTYQAHKGDYFVVISKNNGKLYLAPVSWDNVPSIKMQDKKERISRTYLSNFPTLKKVLHQPCKKVNPKDIKQNKKV